MEQKVWAAIVKGNAYYTCIICGSTELVQAHDPTGKHIDPSVGECLCAGHHADKHPDVPRALFFNKTSQPYWDNISAASLAKRLSVHPRTIIRRAKRLGIHTGLISEEQILQIDNIIYPKRNPPLPRPNPLGMLRRKGLKQFTVKLPWEWIINLSKKLNITTDILVKNYNAVCEFDTNAEVSYTVIPK